MAVEHVNAKGGVNGKKLVLKSADDQTKPDQALQQAREMIKSGVVAIVGPSVVAGCKASGAWAVDGKSQPCAPELTPR